MQQYLTIYSDSSGKVETAIKNSFSEKGTNCLDLEIDGIRFKGSSFDDFQLLEPDNCTEEQIKRFTFNQIPVYNSEEFVWVLCNCSIDIMIPQMIFDIEKDVEINANIRMYLHIGKPMPKGRLSKYSTGFKLEFNEHKFASESDYFETALMQIQKEMMPRFKFKNCFSCHYSDYSPLGNGFFGSMMCFRESKTEYLTASSKEEHFKLASQGFIAVQETYNCEQFAPREKDTGYRGWPFDGSPDEE